MLPTFDLARIGDRGRPVTAGQASRPSGGMDAAAASALLVERREALRALVLSADGLPLAEAVALNPVLGPPNAYRPRRQQRLPPLRATRKRVTNVLAHAA